MEDQKLAVPEQKLTVGDGILAMLNAPVDPKGAARRIPAPLSWLWPVIVLLVIFCGVGILTAPYAISIGDAQIAQRGIPPEQAENARKLLHVIAQITPFLTPIVVVLAIALFAWLVGVVGSMAGLRTRFRDVYALMASCALITALQSIAVIIVVRAKGDEITSQEQLTPPFGLDLLLPNAHGVLFALLNFFSIFEVWYLIVLTLGLAHLAKVSKGKAFFAITPAWILPLLYRVVAAMLQPAAGG
jgi:hypothetical protein